MKKNFYVIWKRKQGIDIRSYDFNQRIEALFYDNQELNSDDITFYTDWSDDHEQNMHYVKRRVKIGEETVMLELPWSNEAVPSTNPVYKECIEEFQCSSDALDYVNQLLSEVNQVPIKDTIHLVDETVGVYRIQDRDGYGNLYESLDFITMSPNTVSTMLFFDSQLEKITKTKLRCDLKEYLSLRDTLTPVKQN
ncbi:hypothetical protein L1999_09355 [Neobacillus drentensis]|uniref:hypothetical protein n=1 Tax=Neobacillus drentensis TaxID=220684 RepID=UPI001F37333B|nr:hypothetical protein [Neobacillus drentensis]ULT58711.1 hypothetical protein L1999_09355 [Neobacillus drentensis]